MKQVLLRVTAMCPEIRFRKHTQSLWRHFSFPRKIFLSQDPLDPDVDRECAQTFVGKEHYTISNLRTHARQLAELFAKIDIEKRRPGIEIGRARTDEPRGRQQIFRAITKRAFAQFLLGTFGNALRRGKCVHHMIVDLARLTKTFTQDARPLPYVGYSFPRRSDECRETFPLWLANDSQTPTKIPRRVHRRIIRKRRANFRKRMIEREIISHDLWLGARLARRLRCLGTTNSEDITDLLHIN